MQDKYRLNWLEDSTDEQLQAIMKQVAVVARKSSRNARMEKRRRMDEIIRIVQSRKEKHLLGQ